MRRVRGVSPELLVVQDADKDTFLHIAVAQGRRALAYALATQMAQCGSLDMKEHNGQTALQIAAATDQHLIVCDLLTHGAKVNTRDSWGRSPLHLCAEKGHFLSLQGLIIDRRASAGPWRGALSPLTSRCSTTMVSLVSSKRKGLTPLHAALLSHNAGVKALRTPAGLCSLRAKELLERKQRSLECVRTLLLMGATCGAKDRKSGRTCLHMASEEANVELLNVLLAQPSSPAIVDSQTFSGNTALHIVCSLQKHHAQVEAAKLLVKSGADPGARNFMNELPSQLLPRGPGGQRVRRILKRKPKYLNN
ncbi:NF-kappa-B inhibitor zeta [Spinachia spinachia]